MLLGRLGYRVLLVDRASFPSDTLSTQFSSSRPAMLRLWGRMPAGPVVAELSNY